MQQAERVSSNMALHLISYFSPGIPLSNLCLLITIFFLDNLSITILVPVDSPVQVWGFNNSRDYKKWC